MADRPTIVETVDRAQSGDPLALQQAMTTLYDDLRDLAEVHFRREDPGHSLQPTALVHESYLRLVGQRRQDWKNREHFLALASLTMRRILTDHARSKLQLKRGGNAQRVPLEPHDQIDPSRPEDVLAVHEALERLETLDPRQAKIVELRFFGGLSVPEVAQALGLSQRTIEAEWTMVRAWLRRELGGELSNSESETVP